MSLHWPWALLALLAFPLLLGVRWWLRRRRRRDTVRVSSVTLIRAALPGPSSWRRRIPLILLAAALAVLGVGVARPSAAVVVPADASAILLAMDISGSMCSSDVSPNRLTVAQDAARAFVKAQANGTKIGLVTFAGTAALVVPPTADKQKLIDAIGQLRTYRGTAIGLGILQAIDAIAEINPDVPPTGVVLDGSSGGGGGYQPDTIVILTDGANTQGVRPETAAEQAAARGLRVYTIGFGTTQPSAFVCTADQLGAGGFGGGGGFGGRPNGGFDGGGGIRRAQQIDEQALTTVAETTGGEYFKAEDATQLNAVLGDLPNNIVLQTKESELTVWFALVGFLLAFAAIGLSFWWNRPPAPRPAAVTSH
jgi:Ca-activated chloride channel family protein